MTSPLTGPTDERALEQARLVHVELAELLTRLRGEGFDPRCILAGAGAAIAEAVSAEWGAHNVPAWFATQFRITTQALQ